jgi:hypothetical protein
MANDSAIADDTRPYLLFGWLRTQITGDWDGSVESGGWRHLPVTSAAGDAGMGMRGRGCVAVRTHYKSRKGAVREPVQESLISAAAPSSRPEVSRASNNILKRKIYRRLSYEFIQVLSYPSVFDACLISHSNVYYR